MLNIDFWLDPTIRDDVIAVSMATGFSHYKRNCTIQVISVRSSVGKKCKNLIICHIIRTGKFFHVTKFEGQRSKGQGQY